MKRLMIMVVAACPVMAAVADYPTEVLADGPVAYWRLNETMASSVSETLKYDGTYEPDSGSPPTSNSTWAVFQNGTLDIAPNTPSAGLADFNDDSSGARMAMSQTYSDVGFNTSPSAHEWEYSFKLELETKPDSATSFMGFGVRGEGNANGKAVALAFNTSGHLCFSGAGFASIKFADLGGSSTDYDDETMHTFTVRKILEAGTMNIKTYVDGSLVDTRAYSTFDNDTSSDGFGIWSGTPGTEHVIVDDVQFSLFAVPPVVDASGNALDGIYVDGVALGVDGAGDDASNLASGFDGVDDCISGTTLGSWGSQITNGVSVEFWVKSTTATDSSLFGVLDNGVSDMGLDIRAHNPSGQTQFWMRDGYFASGHAELAGTISKNLYDGEWHHLVWVIDDCVNNSMKVYVDGAEAALSLTSTGSPDEFGNLTDVVFFGGLNNRGTDLIRPFNGTLDEIAVYDYALGAEDVMIHYNAMLPSLGGTFIVIK